MDRRRDIILIQICREMRKQIAFEKFNNIFSKIQPLNMRKSVYLGTPTSKDQLKQMTYIIKCINLSSETRDARMEMKNIEEAYLRLKKLYANSQAIFYKPELFSIDQKQKLLYLVQLPFQVSLQSLILWHQSKRQSMSKWLVHNFACKIYDGINRLKVAASQILQSNIKPSNIFLTRVQSEIEWKITQLGILTSSLSVYYLPIVQLELKSKTNISSIYQQQHQYNLHSFGMILLEMVTLMPIKQLYQHFKTGANIKDLKYNDRKCLSQIKNEYGGQLTDLISGLLHSKQSVKNLLHEYKDTNPQFSTIPNYSKQKIEINNQTLLKISKQNPFNKIIQKIKHNLQKNNIPCSDMLQKCQKYDKDLQFVISKFQDIDNLIQDFGVGLQTQDVYQLSFYVRGNSIVNYMDIFRAVYSVEDVIFSVIKIGIQNSMTRKAFFNDYAGGKEVWKSEDLTKYLRNVAVYIEQKQVNKVLQTWTGVSKRTFIKFDEFNKIFKAVGTETMSGFKNQNKNKQQKNEKTITDVLHELKQKLQMDNKNLISFFRGFDRSNKWVVNAEIQKQLGKRINMNDKCFNQICEQMWEIGSVGTQSKKILNYVLLLKITKIYSMTQLFKMVLVQKINQSNRTQFYRSYQKDQKGWSIRSLEDFNDNQQLDFQKRQLNLLFNQFDKDHSGYLSEKELIYHLTGLKQFDKQLLVENIRDQSSKWDLFQVFIRMDRNKDLYYDSPGDLLMVFEFMKIDVPSQHCQDLYRSGMKNGKYPYLDFLRYFIAPSLLFVKSCQFFIDYLYQGNFQKFYEIGRIKNKKKWNLQSFNRLNQEFLIGFTYNEVGQIWQAVNPQKQQSLTKEQIAKIFNCSCEPEQNILGLHTNEKAFEKDNRNKKHQSINTTQNKEKIKDTHKDQTSRQNNQLIDTLSQRKISEIMLCLIRKSRQNGQITLNDFCSCLDELKIKYLRNIVMKSTGKFQRMDEQKNVMKINFIQLLMFVCQNEEEGKEERKAQCFMIVIKELMRFYNLTLTEVFKKCRKSGIMKLTDYENFLRDLIKTQVYFDDIEDSWKFYGYPDHLIEDDFNKILNSTFDKDKPGFKAGRAYSFAENDGIKQDQTQSPYFPKRKRSSDAHEIQYKKGSSRNVGQNVQQSQKGQNNLEKNSNQNNAIRETGFKQQMSDIRQSSKEPNKNYGQNLPPKPIRKSEIRQNENNKANEKMIKKQTTKQITKGGVIQKFEDKIREKSSDALNRLFSKVSSIKIQEFTNFLQDNYDFNPQESQKMAQILSSFGKVKIESVKKYLRKMQSPEKDNKQSSKDQIDNKNTKKQQRRERSSMQEEVGKNQQKIDHKKGSEKIKFQANYPQKDEINEHLRLQDPRKIRINVPLVKEHIKILISSFIKRYDINEMEPFFFQGNTTLDLHKFIQKCLGIHPSISKQMYEKIFMYLKPKAGLISSISFKLSFNFDEQIHIDESYLPDEIEQQIKTIFQKADKDKSGFIEPNEIQSILSSLGINQSQKQIQNYFQKIDQDFDKKISLKEFRMFIQDNILPYISDFDEDVDQLESLCKMNDVFRTGFIPVTTLGLVLDKFGVKIGQKDITVLNRFMANQNGEVFIKQLIKKLYMPTNQNSTALKSILYRIRWRRKISFKDVQKIFQNISSCFVNSYTSKIIKSRALTASAFIMPVLNESKFFYNDFQYKDFSKLDIKTENLINTVKNNDLIVQLKFIDATGLPIPQNQSVKNGILNRSVNVTFYDTSSEQAKDCITSVQIQFDPDVQDQWIFNKNNRSIFVKIANYQPRKYDKILVLIEFIATLVDGSKSIDISCGIATVPVKELQVDSKIMKKIKIIAGLPNKSKDIDKTSVTKRKGWRGFIGSGEIDSQFQIQLSPSAKFQDKLPLIAVLPQKTIVNRKALHFMSTFREYFAYKSADQKRINPDYGQHFIVKTFALSIDILDVYEDITQFWKEKIQPKTQDIFNAKRVFQFLMTDLHIIIHSKQFDLLPSFPTRSTFMNKSLKSTRKKLISEIFSNIQEWVNGDPRADYKRRRPYAVDSGAFIVQQRQPRPETKQIVNLLLKAK